MKVNNFGGDLMNVSAKTELLVQREISQVQFHFQSKDVSASPRWGQYQFTFF